MKKLLAILLGLTIGGVALANTFPTTLNSWTSGDTISSAWANALETKIGVDSSAVVTSLDYKASNGQTAYGWGNHASAGYFPFSSWYATTTDALDEGSTNKYADVTKEDHGETAYGWGNHSGLYDILGQATSTLSSHTTTYNHANYDTAYGWGDHSAAGYFPLSTWYATTSKPNLVITKSQVSDFGSPVYTESDPLALKLTDWYATTTKSNLSITKSQVSDFGTYENPLTFTYPLSRATNAISLAFGTTTSNTWAGTQTFTNAPILSSLATAAGTFLAADPTGTIIATTTPSGVGDVVWQSSSTATDNAIVRFDSTTGKLIQGYTSNPPTISDTGAMTLSGSISLNGNGVTSASSMSYTANYGMSLGGSTHTDVINASKGAVNVVPTYNQAGKTGMVNTDLLIKRTETSLGTSPGTQLLIDGQVGASSVFSVDNTGKIAGSNIIASSATATSTFAAPVTFAKTAITQESTIATSTSMTINWATANQQLVRLGTAGVTIAHSNYQAGQTLRLVVCNPAASASTITWSGVLWPGGTAPTHTTTANQCDLYTFDATNGTSTLIILGGYAQAY